MRRPCGWFQRATLSVALAVVGTMAVTMPAHAYPITGLGQAGSQVDRCQMATPQSPVCGAATYASGGAGSLWSGPVIEPAVGVRPFVCPRGPENE